MIWRQEATKHSRNLDCISIKKKSCPDAKYSMAYYLYVKPNNTSDNHSPWVESSGQTFLIFVTFHISIHK